MIELAENRDCCGCAACVQVCPKQCIDLLADHEGFLYPHTQLDRCVDCGLCERVCPVINQPASGSLPYKLYAAKCRDEEVRAQSSSGGMFTLLAERVIADGGVVFAARYDENWEVEHAYTETLEGLPPFRGSKYMQSRVGNTFKQAQLFLQAGRAVLYVGTPCQIAGLKLFLRKSYDRLLTVDFVCHGTPSPKVWRHYLQATISGAPATIKGVNFRDKTNGWRHYNIKVWGDNSPLLCQPASKNTYMKGFIKDIYLRPSCHACPSKAHKSGSDITLADYWRIWNIHPTFDNDKGASLVLVNTPRYDTLVQELPCDLLETTYANALVASTSLMKSAPMTNAKKRAQLFDHIDDATLLKTLDKMVYDTYTARLIELAKQFIVKLLVVTKIKKR